MKPHSTVCIQLLEKQGIMLDDIALLVYDLQYHYIPEITMDLCRESVMAVLDKREVRNTIFVALELDEQARRRGYYNKELEKLVSEDNPLFGVDEVLAFGICNIYGSIALTNFGYLDKLKPGIIGRLNEHKQECNTFIDDIVGAVAAAAASRFAHRNEEGSKEMA